MRKLVPVLAAGTLAACAGGGGAPKPTIDLSGTEPAVEMHGATAIDHLRYLLGEEQARVLAEAGNDADVGGALEQTVEFVEIVDHTTHEFRPPGHHRGRSCGARGDADETRTGAQGRLAG